MRPNFMENQEWDRDKFHGKSRVGMRPNFMENQEWERDKFQGKSGVGMRSTGIHVATSIA